jgi:uncharacterized membrane protein
MQCVRAFWFRDVCRVMAIIVFLYSIHPMTLGLPQPKLVSPLLEPFAPAVGHAQPAPEPAPENGLASVLAVGRTLSSFSVAEIPENRLTITYTVFNQQASTVTGVLLVTRLRPGVTFEAATPSPDRNGRELAWSLGTLSGFAAATVQLTVTLDTPIPLQLDNGARAFGILNARMERASASPAILRADALPQNLLRSTLDANTTDPFILAQAAALGNDPARIFAFVRDQIAFESYTGSLRGARGTLWSRAGNALDQASLLIALLRASGIPARYVQGTLPNNLARQLILSMFPASAQRLGFIPVGTAVSDPADSPQLLMEVREHYWVELDRGNGFEAADPTMAGAQIGQVFVPSERTFAEVVDTLRHKVTLRLQRELTTLLSALFGAPAQDMTPVLEETFNTVEVIGKPLTIGHFVNTVTLPSPVFVSITNTYSPFIVVGDQAFALSRNRVIRGQDYQEVLTNFPFGSQILTGLFLEMSVSGPDGPTETFERTLVDRIGFAVRRNGGTPALSIDPAGVPILTEFDVFTVHVLPGLDNPSPSILLGEQLTQQSQRLVDLQRPDGSFPPEASSTLRSFFIAQTQALGNNFFAISDLLTAQFSSASMVKAYCDRPRLVLVSSRVKVQEESRTGTPSFAIDLRRDTLRTIAFPGQNATASSVFNFARGLVENIAEREVLSLLSPDDGSPLQSMSTVSIFEAALEQGIGLAVLAQDNLTALDALDISVEAKARITEAIARENLVIVPNRGVLLNGTTAIGWYEVEPDTGEAVGVMEDGGHQAIVEWAGVGAAIGVGVGFVLRFTVLPLCQQFNNQRCIDAFRFVKNPGGAIGGIISGVVALAVWPGGTSLAALSAANAFLTLLLAAVATFILGVTLVLALSGVDPPLSPFLSNLDFPPLGQSNNATVERAVSASLDAGPVQGTIQSPHVSVSNQLAVSWTTETPSGFMVESLHTSNASVRDANGMRLGSGAVALTALSRVPVAIAGQVMYNVSGQGNLSFYAPATTDLGVSGTWDTYTATLSGTITLQLTTDALTLNGNPLPAGTYTIIASAATLTGSGPSTSPNFVGIVTLDVVDGVIQLGPGTDNLTVGGNRLSTSNGLTFQGFDGTIAVTAGEATDRVELNGTTTHVLRVSGNPPVLTADQNTPASFTLAVDTSLNDTYRVTVEAPQGWTVTIDANGLVSVTPAPGLQSGSFALRLVAQSQAMPELVAQGTVTVTLGETPPGITLQIVPDPQFTVPVNGAQVPLAFRAIIGNLGPVIDTINLTFPNLPAGFEILHSGTTVTVPGGETGVVGLYLRPIGRIDPPGTPASLRVTATSMTNPTIRATDTEAFSLPEVHGVTFSSDPTVLNTTPGVPVSTTLTLTSVGNVPESVRLTAPLPSGLTVSGLGTVSLGVGESATQALILTPAADTPLNTLFAITITASFGSEATPFTQITNVGVQVAAPGAQAAVQAAATAGQLGNPDLVNTLNTLSIALTNLVQIPTNPVFNGQTLAQLDSLQRQLSTDAFLARFADELTRIRAALAAANTAREVRDVVRDLGQVLDDFNAALTGLAEHRFEVTLLPTSQVAQPQIPAQFQLLLRNTGTQSTRYTFRLSPLPAGVTGAFSQNSVTLAPGEQIPGPGVPNLFVTLTPTSTTALLPFDFTVTVAASEVPELTRTVQGALIVREEFVSVVAITAEPAFTEPGAEVTVSARVLNAVNQQRSVMASYVVRDPAAAVVFTSTPQTLELSVVVSLVTVDLGTLDTTGFARGTYTIEVALTDTNGQPIPGATGEGRLLIGSPVTAALTLAPETLPPGTGTVTTTLQITGEVTGPPPLTLLGQLAIASAAGLAVRDTLAYVCGGNGINVVDLTDPTNPALVRTIGPASRGCTIVDELLLANEGFSFSSFVLAVYSLRDDPRTPVFLGRSAPIPYGLYFDLQATRTHAFVDQFLECHFIRPVFGDVYFQGGDLLAVALNLNDPQTPTAATPALVDVLFNTQGDTSSDPTDVSGCPENGGDNHVWQLARVDAQTLLLATTTITGTDTQTGVGRILVVDIADPANLRVVRELLLPNMAHAIGIAVDGDRALVAGSTGGWRDFFSATDPDLDLLLLGNLVFTVLDLSDPRNPQILGSRSISRRSRTFFANMTALGSGLFGFTNLGGTTDAPQIVLIDAKNPNNLTVGQTDVPTAIIGESGIVGPNGIRSAGNLVLVTGEVGLLIYQLGAIPEIPVTAQVQIPRTTGVTVVPNSFSIPPTEIRTATDFDTLVWELTLGQAVPGQTLTWQSMLTGVQPGESRDVTRDTTIDFTMQGTPGQLPLAPLTVASGHLLGLTPATRSVRPGATAAYTVRVTNPASVTVVYTLSVQGIPSNWVTLSSPVTVAAQGTVEVPLTLSAEAFTALAEYGFVVVASGDNGARDTVSGLLRLQGEPVITPVEVTARGVVLTLTPTQALTGPGTATTFALQVANTGSDRDTFTLAVSAPAGFTVRLAREQVTVPPGAGNFRDVLLALTPPAGIAPGDYPFTVTATSTTNAALQATSTGTLRVAGAGVTATIQPRAGPPGTTFRVTLTNTGQVGGTFDLTLAGPAALFATLDTAVVTLAPGASQVVRVQVGAIAMALLGSLPLLVVATVRSSATRAVELRQTQGNEVVQASVNANVIIGATQGLTANFDPMLIELPNPGAASFLLEVQNTGNAEDAYSAEITGTSGPVSAALLGPDGSSAQNVPLFRLPGLATGAILLNTTLMAQGTGTVTVTVTSLNTPGTSVTATATLRTPQPPPPTDNLPPVADAGPERNVAVGRETVLNGSGSFDPERARLTFAWRFESVPAGSQVTDTDLLGRTLPSPRFTPDVAGAYLVQLLVNDGALDSAPDGMTITAHPGAVPPTAVPEVDPVATVGQLVVLDGGASHDVDTATEQLTFRWTFAAVAAGSALASTDITAADTAVATFEPDVAGVYVVRLEVADGQASDVAEVSVTVGVGDLPPVAVAGDDQAVFVETEVRLDGSASHDPGGPPNVLTFQWHLVFVPPGSRLTNEALQPVAATNSRGVAASIATVITQQAVRERVRFTPDVAGPYVVRLVVSDGTQEAGDNVLILALAGNRQVRLKTGGGCALSAQGQSDLLLPGMLVFLLAMGGYRRRQRRRRTSPSLAGPPDVV